MSLSPELATACWYSAILLVKLATHSLLVSYQRLTRKVFANEEDAANGAGAVKLDDPNVERVRRCHLNDMENILPFIGLLLLFASTGSAGLTEIKVVAGMFTVLRFLYTIAYIKALQPARGITYTIGVLITFYMGFRVFIHLL